MDYHDRRKKAVESSSPSESAQWDLINQLIEAETILATETHPDFDGFLKTIQAKPQFPQTRRNDNELQWYMRILHYDLFTDLHSLFTSDSPRLVDLVSKKLTVLANVPENITIDQQNYHAILDPVLVKMAHYLVLADGDFRTPSVVARLIEMMPPLDDLTSQCLSLAAKRRLVPVSLWSQTIHNFDNPVSRRLVASRPDALRYNHLETNIVCLPNYYDAVSLAKIPKLLGQEAPNLEAVVHAMIVSGKLPDGTKIDQVNHMLVFRDPVEHTHNDKSTRVCKAVEEIVRMIENDG